MARPKIRRFRQSFLQNKLGINSIGEQEKRAKRKRVREFISPERFRPKKKVRKVRKSVRRKGRSAISVFGQIAPARRRRR